MNVGPSRRFVKTFGQIFRASAGLHRESMRYSMREALPGNGVSRFDILPKTFLFFSPLSRNFIPLSDPFGSNKRFKIVAADLVLVRMSNCFRLSSRWNLIALREEENAWKQFYPSCFSRVVLLLEKASVYNGTNRTYIEKTSRCGKF